MKNVIHFTLLILIVSSIIGCKKKSVIDSTFPIDYSILIPKINHQQLPEGTSMQVHFAAIDNDLEQLVFSTNALPAFIKMVTYKNGTGYFEINATEGSIGKYDIILFAKNEEENGKQSFTLKVLPKLEKALYLSPESHNVEASGTKKDPLPALEILTNSDKKIEAGMNLILMDGYHGHPDFKYKKVHVYAAANANPVISGINFKNAKQSSINGIEISREGNADYIKDFYIHIDSLSEQIEISNCQIRTAKNTEDWTQVEWDERAGSGIMVKGDSNIIRNTLFENLFHALQTNANSTQVEYNIIDRFSGDAIRNQGDDNFYVKNLIKNAVVDDYYDEGGNHDDCFQSWTFDAPIRNISLIDNIAISCLEPNLPLKSKVVQGFACFDGFEEGWVVKGNLIIIDHPHGIALFGAKNCSVINNTILRNPYQFFTFESDPWIMINNHKDGRPSMKNRVEGNICGALEIKDSLGVQRNNVLMEKDSIYFKDYKGWDFRY